MSSRSGANGQLRHPHMRPVGRSILAGQRVREIRIKQDAPARGLQQKSALAQPPQGKTRGRRRRGCHCVRRHPFVPVRSQHTWRWFLGYRSKASSHSRENCAGLAQGCWAVRRTQGCTPSGAGFLDGEGRGPRPAAHCTRRRQEQAATSVSFLGPLREAERGTGGQSCSDQATIRT